VASPLGKQFRIASGDSAAGPWYTVVGVARDAVQGEIGRPRPQVFVTGEQSSLARVIVRAASDGEAAALVPRIRSVVAELDPGVAVFGPRLLRDVVERLESYWMPRLWSGLIGTFALVALTIAA